MLSYRNVLALEALLLLVEVATDIGWQLLHQCCEELRVASRVTLISKLSHALLKRQAKGPADAIGWSLDFDDACFWVSICQV